MSSPGAKQNAVILARVSSKSQEDEGYSLDSQLKLLRGYCENKELRVVKIFKIAETASKEQSRKVFHELLTYIAKEEIFHLAVEKTDRFTRNFRDAVAIDEWLDKDENRFLHAVKENLLLHKNAKSDVKFMWNIHVSVAKKYADNLREEAMKGWAEKLAQGWLPSFPPPGYKTVTENGKRIHVPDPTTKTQMQQVFAKYLEPGQTISTIADEMALIGVRTRYGRPHSRSHIQKILMNPFYIGVNRFKDKDYPGAQQPIIPKDIFRNVQIKLHGGRPAAYLKHNPVFKGMIRCEDCGSSVTWQYQRGHYYGACRRESEACKQGKLLREDYIEVEIVKKLEELACPDKEMAEWITQAMRKYHQETIVDHETLTESIQMQIKRITRMEDVLYDDKLSEEISPEKYEEKHGQLIAQKGELRDKLAMMERPLSERLEQRLVILQLSQRAAELYPKKTNDQKRLIMSNLFEKLTLKNGSLSVGFKEFIETFAEKTQQTRRLMELQ